MGSDYRKLLPTPCYGCVIDIVGWKYDSDRGWVNVGVHSGHVTRQRAMWRDRFSRAIAALRNDDLEGYLDFHSREEVDRFISSLEEAREVSFPPAAPA